jgi:hypothetical protein
METEDDLILFMEHFIKQITFTKQKPILLLLDCHQSRISLRVLELPKENEVVLLSFPRHAINKLKPLY